MGRVKARKTIEGSLSREGIDHIVKELDTYQTNVKHATAKFVKRLAQKGYGVARAYIQYAEMTADEDKDIGTLTINMDEQGHVASCRLIFEGSQVLFVEFGAGFTYNQGDEHPLAGEFGYGVGTFPYQKHAYDPKGWSYFGNDDSWHHTKGTEATMPMYNASQQMRNDIVAVAKEVFGSVV